MAKATEKLFRTFVKGIITEASPLTYPENASIDEDNFVLNRNGSRDRRLGVDYETDYTLQSTGLTSANISTSKQSFHKWESPGGDTTVAIGVIRIYNRLWFIDLLTANPSDNLLNGGNYLELSSLQDADIETTIINNKMVIASIELEKPILLTYNPIDQTISQSTIDIKVRDIWGVEDSLKFNERPTFTENDVDNKNYLNNITVEHLYNLRNQGWNKKIINRDDSKDAIKILFRYKYYYPSNADLWTFGKNTNATSGNYEKFDERIFERNAVYSGLSSKGTYVIDAFNRGSSRESAFNEQTGLPTDKENGRITTVASYAGRVFYSGISSQITDPDAKSPNYSGYIFFSQVVTEDTRLSLCYQNADPTDPAINDPVESDGGTIQIPECSRIIKIVPSRTSLIVFAENGVWEVFGDTNGFTATSFQVSKITTYGITNSRSVVNIGGNFVYWSKAGIFLLNTDQASGRFIATNLSLTSIQTLYLGISEIAKQYAKGFYDERENRVRWLYNDQDTYTENNYINKYNRELIYDLTLQSFYTNTFSSLNSNSPYIADYINIPAYAVSQIDTQVISSNENVIDTNNDLVVITLDELIQRTVQFSFLTIVGTSFTISKFKDTNFEDWATAGGGKGQGATYSSYLVTGYELFNDLLRDKVVPYIFFHFTRTETGFDDSTGTLQLTNPSSCLVQSQWNWTDSASSGKWGTQFQAYKFLRNYIPSGVADDFDYGEAVIVTKNKLRGSGKCLSLKIQSENYKDMKLLGWGVTAIATSNP